MSYYLQICGIPSNHMSSSALLCFDNKRYLFNTGEGLQRFNTEFKAKINKITDIFITAIDPDTLGALPGVMLSMMEAGVPNFHRKIHGPPGIAAYIQSTLTFVWNEIFDIIEYGNENFEAPHVKITTERVFRDENITVHVISAFREENSFYEFPEGRRMTPSSSGIIYIIEGKLQPPKFRVDKAKALGVPPGKLYGRLSAGETIEIGDKIITPDQVLDPAPPAPAFAILHFPTEDLLTQNIQSSLHSILSSLSSDFSAILSFSPSQVLLNPIYHSLISQFPADCKHLLFSSSLISSYYLSLPPTSIYKSSDTLLAQLNAICPELFNFSPNDWKEINSDEAESLKKIYPNAVIPQLLMKIKLSPAQNRGIDIAEAIKPFNYEEAIKAVQGLNFESEAQCHGLPYENVIDIKKLGADPEILLLGTASMKPGKYRNVSSTWLGGWGGSLLLDCGEGTYSQLIRRFGSSINQVLLDLSGILISHLHADHQIGIIKLLHERAKLTNSPIIVVAPSNFEVYLNVCNLLMGPLHYTFQPVAETQTIPGLKLIQTVAVIHRIEAYGFIIDHESGWRIVYSGDTRPSENLATAGNGATLLIHEATFEDELQTDAVEKMHSTLSEALNIAQSMNAWKVVLTHFSQRYSKIPKTTQVDAILGLDLMKFKLSDAHIAIENMSKLLKILDALEEKKDS
ncbi:unnamed protein product [Blepharisma stoltei]|uniref:ribonuclease Z n=1 Tax=Blepharisma stoltei TaxID=1481888 RepID=A0AAU9JUS0_9CILI|nr:unnamed protein product [Blepharisma stoltei]